MAKLTLTDIAAGYALIATVNANNALVETALENTLSRDGTTPNTMSASLDMNSQFITNLPTPTANSHAATKTYVDTITTAIAAASGTFSGAVVNEFTNQQQFIGDDLGIRIASTDEASYINISHDGTATVNVDATSTTTFSLNSMYLHLQAVYGMSFRDNAGTVEQVAMGSVGANDFSIRLGTSSTLDGFQFEGGDGYYFSNGIDDVWDGAISCGSVGFQDGVGTGGLIWSNTAGDDSLSAVANGATIQWAGTTGLFTKMVFGEGSFYPLDLDGADESTLTEWAGLTMAERADHPKTPAAGTGQLWIKNTTPCQLWFTDDAGSDTQIV